MYVGLAEHICF